MSSKEKSFQDYFPGNSCYGCGPANKYGMHVTKSDWVTSEHRETMCNWKIKKKYSSAVAGLHGGTSASLVDCHSVWTAIAARYDLEKRPFGSKSIICYVTAEMLIKYLKPVPMNAGLVSIISKVEELKEESRKCILFTELVAKGIICVTAKVIAVRVELSEEVVHGLLNPPKK
ncbi:hypothetical protein A2662_01595 [Candidatus Giovannonibacteria bacterium RIFCSPHIGHO2_01_FULL_45_33]|uniref:Thioesterase domain-containing protein n=1 Tax=Candidatus Giovannonibacteria bacterium RIFCSPLOWO2_01_FULL_45_34 TaxID=1798351 RepID=A0A1F5X0J1_9BACT|nr:MAG: hypothetical protein A2662_01595 [Candidatus Giovannonibacteria bacterium RIFCSPHIGHO2_01_FULL_45_33]OGF70723.1 MAG: hypothetical protein A3C73_03055 [Candidatus Giovannonibacteria bacterium RIFCSPHIGHO2_02_FULL_44_11]OGF81416.1 MAG: hypothetical protein A2930_01310 [Candidatus Giovannonibacteria bacterium RIFCSPLOWO2_01_FULL_45_34]